MTFRLFKPAVLSGGYLGSLGLLNYLIVKHSEHQMHRIQKQNPGQCFDLKVHPAPGVGFYFSWEPVNNPKIDNGSTGMKP